VGDPARAFPLLSDDRTRTYIRYVRTYVPIPLQPRARARARAVAVVMAFDFSPARAAPLDESARVHESRSTLPWTGILVRSTERVDSPLNNISRLYTRVCTPRLREIDIVVTSTKNAFKRTRGKVHRARDRAENLLRRDNFRRGHRFSSQSRLFNTQRAILSLIRSRSSGDANTAAAYPEGQRAARVIVDISSQRSSVYVATLRFSAIVKRQARGGRA